MYQTKNLLPNKSQTLPVVPLPINGSNTNSNSLEEYTLRHSYLSEKRVFIIFKIKMSKILFVLLILPLVVISQNINYEYTSNGVYSKSNVVDSEGNHLVVGGFKGYTNFLDDSTNNVFISKPNNMGTSMDSYIIKFANDGEVDWIKTFGGDSKDNAISVILGNDNSIYVSGWFEDEIVLFDGTVFNTTGITGTYLLKIDSNNGNLIWGRDFKDGVRSAPNGITLDNNTGEVILIDSYAMTSYGYDFYRLNPNSGDIVFQRYINLGGDFLNVQTDNYGNTYFTVNDMQSFSLDGVSLTGPSFSNAIIVKLDSEFKCVGGLNLGTPKTDGVSELKINPINNDIYVSVIFGTGEVNVNPYGENTTVYGDCGFFGIYGNDFLLKSFHTYIGSVFDPGMANVENITFDKNFQNITLFGNIINSSQDIDFKFGDGEINTNIGKSFFSTYSLNDNFEHKITSFINYSGNDGTNTTERSVWLHVNDYIISSDFGYNLSFYDQNSNLLYNNIGDRTDSSSSRNTAYSTVASLDYGNTLSLNYDLLEEVSDKMKLYPNPFNDIVNVKTNNKVNKITVFNLSGEILLKSINRTVVDTSKLNSGIYLFKVETGYNSKFFKLIK